MVKVRTLNYIDCEDIKELTGISWDYYQELDECENDSYHVIDLSDVHYFDLEADWDEYNQLYLNACEVKDEVEMLYWNNRKTKVVNERHLIVALRHAFESNKIDVDLEEVAVYIHW